MAKPIVQSSNDDLYSVLLSTSQDGRARNLRYRQHVLLFMHNFLRKNVDRIQTCIKQDIAATQSEVDVEIAMSLAVIRRFYDQIDFNKAIKDEFRISRKEDNPLSRIPYGIVLIRPTTHTRFFSIISAAAAALAAGNVVLLELENSLRTVDGFFRNDFRVYDGDIFVIATSHVDEARLNNTCVIVDQMMVDTPRSEALKHHPDRVSLAVVDRTADLSLAAKAIIKSKFAFHGSSPFAVDTVLVNEWIRKEFIAELEIALKSEAQLAQTSAALRPQEAKVAQEQNETELFASKGLHVSELSRSSKALGNKSPTSKLHLVTVSGLVDATSIYLELSPLLALYCFSDPHCAKYLGQYIDSSLCIVNQIPTTLLVGPSLPAASTVADLAFRYEISMLSRPSPQLIGNVDRSLDGLYLKEMKPLKAFKQGSGWDIGFFPRSILIGLFVVGVPSFCVLSYGVIRTGLYGYHNYLITYQ